MKPGTIKKLAKLVSIAKSIDDFTLEEMLAARKIMADKSRVETCRMYLEQPQLEMVNKKLRVRVGYFRKNETDKQFYKDFQPGALVTHLLKGCRDSDFSEVSAEIVRFANQIIKSVNGRYGNKCYEPPSDEKVKGVDEQ